MLKNTSWQKNNMTHIIKQEGLYQNKVTVKWTIMCETIVLALHCQNGKATMLLLCSASVHQS